MDTPQPETTTPSWAHCAHGADPAADPVGCRGIHVPGRTACLAHLADADRDTYLASLAPGASIDHRGTPFTEDLLNQLLDALRDPTSGRAQLGRAQFFEAQFSGRASFSNAEFTGPTDFGWARFTEDAIFTGAHFTGLASFGWARFTGSARFYRSQFSGRAGFAWAQFNGPAEFFEVRFGEHALFYRARFTDWASFVLARFAGDVDFAVAQFTNHADFSKVEFSVASRWGPMVCGGTLDLSGAVFSAPVTMEIAASEVRCERTRWESTATVRVRRASLDLSYAVLAAPVAVTAHPVPFTAPNGDDAVDGSPLTGPEGVRVASVQGVDAAHLVLTDTDLSDCLFSGAFHLDQLRLEGRTVLAPTPTGWHRRGIAPLRWTRRRALAEEHHWRAQTAAQPAVPAGILPPANRWRTGPDHPDPARTPDPDDVAALYRQLRKAFEDGKNEPGAADFYYGECEMRRHDHTGTPKTERRLLWAYWLLSGYGLRASRALGWLAAAMLTTILLLMAFGLPASSPKQKATGTIPPGGGEVIFTIDKQDPKNPTGDRFTSKRFDKALSVTLNSVVFRSSGQDLTTAGTYIEMTSRILEPALLALAVLAIRGRIKR
ncbi:pentapeptide repeat-containing protein [Streptomyces sp. NPDC050848]|uniref:pentapeptide repeat-containing protein n=1 Tax=Streptomyces sp. NPDC050848 TaxID=3155791 RepID=UPI0033CE6F15